MTGVVVTAWLGLKFYSVTLPDAQLVVLQYSDFL